MELTESDDAPPLHPGRAIRLVRAARSIPGFGAVGLALAMIAGAAGARSEAHIDALSVAYFLAVVLVAMCAGRRAALFVAIAATGAGLAAELAAEDVTDAAAGVNAAVRFVFLTLFAYATTAVRDLVEELDQRSTTDELTGLLNWRGFRQLAQGEIRRTTRTGEPMTIVYFDLDDLKRVNDESGHDAGDAVLRKFADGIRACSRVTDIAGRLGGDEFALLLPSTDAEGATAMLDRLAQYPGQPPASAGAATWLHSPTDVRSLLSAADRLMYRAKETNQAYVSKVVAPA